MTKIGPGPDFNPSDPAFCKGVSELSAAQMPVALKTHRTVRTSLGNTCQWEVGDKDMATRGATSTVMYKTRDNCWVGTCNFDTRETQTLAACSEVLACWKFD